ncbi:MAG TPA: RNA polymerase-binding protein DksA [Campylobacterales bacterium]|jgi:DnaK suppressor protein|nr:RNA polymerase-binding protein DksA [Campylobacterales bacterium]HHC11346.1 RNA polymerase-binding protein DksA [Campylobacterales bacterium]HHD81176.1 RNA polymerase-binding protein DksA [Campylobacterales bacterium]
MLNTEDIKFFKTALEARRDRIKKNLNITTEEMNGLNSNDLRDEADFASTSLGRAVDNAILTQQANELAEIELALGKISENLYGICEMCEEEINIERLKVKIFARYCITCREVIEKEHK